MSRKVYNDCDCFGVFEWCEKCSPSPMIEHKKDTISKSYKIQSLEEKIKLLESELAKEREKNLPCYCDETSTRNCPRHQRSVPDNE